MRVYTIWDWLVCALAATALLVAAAVVIPRVAHGQDVAQVSSAAQAQDLPNPLADKVVELIMLGVMAGVVALQEWLRRKLRKMLSATVVDVEKRGNDAEKAAIQEKSKQLGVASDLDRVVQKETKRFEKPPGGMGLALLFLLPLLSACGVSQEVLDDIHRVRAGYQAVVEAGDATPREREMALDGIDMTWAVEFGLGEVDDIPYETRVRLNRDWERGE